MLASVRATGQPVAGMLWYQGESDANALDAPHYTRRMRQLVKETRKDLGQPKLPWIVVQLGKYFFNGPAAPWNSVREQQRQLPAKIACNIADERDFSLPAFGPVEIGRPQARLPFVTKWKVSRVLPAPPSFARMAFADFAGTPSTLRSYKNFGGFVNERPRWDGRPGLAFFAADLVLSEGMRLEFLMGYDGPFRLELDGRPFFTDLGGTNPAVMDESRKTVRLAAGRHRIRVAMDTNEGRAWGFFLRFIRKDVPLSAVRSGNYVRPEYRV